MSAIRELIEKCAGEDVDVSSLPELDIGEDHLATPWYKQPWVYNSAAFVPWLGRPLGRRLRGAAGMAGRRMGFTPITNWAQRRGGSISPNVHGSATKATPWEAARQLRDGLAGKKWYHKIPGMDLQKRMSLEGQYAMKIPGAAGKTMDNLSRMILPRSGGMKTMQSLTYGGIGQSMQHVKNEKLLRTMADSALHEQDRLRSQGANEINDRRKDILLESRMPALAGTALGAGLGGMLGSQMSSSSRKERIRKLAQAKGISEAEAAKLIGPDDSGSGFLGGGIGGIGGYLLANNMYPPELSEAGLDTVGRAAGITEEVAEAS